ncbi:MAG: hypothetical protein U5N26_11155 [Candidatus Marinimicrobia bacterium]|nr:hypothetical protein [Candidatus Neomarinimicrobiota bacterium]
MKKIHKEKIFRRKIGVPVLAAVLFLANTVHAGIPGYYFRELRFHFSGEDSVLVNSVTLGGHDGGNQQGPYGMVKDPEGKTWVGFYAGYSNEYRRDTDDVIRLTGIRCFLPDGSEAPFSPLEFIAFEDGTKDTLYRNSPYNGNCRGISLSEDGHILYTARATLMKIDHRDGSGIARWHPGMDGKPVRTFVKAAHDPVRGHIYFAPYPQQETIWILDEDLRLLDTALTRTPTLQNALIARTTAGGITQLLFATHANGKGIFLYESEDPGVLPFVLTDTLGNCSETTDSNTISYIAWPASLDWLDREAGSLFRE